MTKEKERDQDPLIVELDNWTRLISTPEWKHFVVLMKKRKEWLQRQVNVCLKQHEDRRAGEFRARMEDVDTIFRKVQDRIAQLRKGGEKG